MSVGTEREPMVRPPALRTGQEASASNLELFFDLAYVLVVNELAVAFLKHLTWSGVGTFVALFIAIWTSWVGYTLYANRFDTDDVLFRIAKLAATLSIAGCAASAATATSSFSTPFAVCFLAGRVILLGLYARAWRHVPDARGTIDVYLATIAASSALWAVSLAFGGPARYWLWGAAVVVDAVGPVIATWRDNHLPLHMEHLPERFGLFVILVLGEAVGGAAIGVHDAAWGPSAVAVGVAGFVIAAAMWWIYFDTAAAVGAAALRRRDDESRDDGTPADERHDLFVYGHLPLALGVVMAGVGVEELVLHPGAALPSAGGWALAAGVALFLIGTALVLGGSSRSWRAIWPWPVAAVPLAPAAAAFGHHRALLLVAGLALLCLGLAVRGTVVRRNGGSGPVAGKTPRTPV
ncbi:low temperature requirement protein A [Amycolatopsis sp. A133]|uniref:low temperature requirement protein A n=1 Tax=Amycolatopsis sp. A133 TaxID=3064472 RepID=UPI0027FED528|nr:low temperature requirement protein A [Amycolatopsis sp. A133]MDQ7809806.1 low temperature requirement protein A [Amycolatopsis sp. A133]